MIIFHHMKPSQAFPAYCSLQSLPELSLQAISRLSSEYILCSVLTLYWFQKLTQDIPYYMIPEVVEIEASAKMFSFSLFFCTLNITNAWNAENKIKNRNYHYFWTSLSSCSNQTP